MGLFRRKKKVSLSELQGVPDGTFRCDVCRFIQPLICLCGTVVDTVSNLPPKTHILCSSCALWLGFGKPRFPQGLCFNFSDEQRKKIRALHKELDIVDQELEKKTLLSIGLAYIDREEGLEEIHGFLERVPNLRELIRLCWSLLPQNIISLSARLTKGEFVDPSEIKEVNEG